MGWGFNGSDWHSPSWFDWCVGHWTGLGFELLLLRLFGLTDWEVHYKHQVHSQNGQWLSDTGQWLVIQQLHAFFGKFLSHFVSHLNLFAHQP